MTAPADLMSIVIEHAVTVDMEDGQVLPPFIEDDVVWHVVRRLPNTRTLWRRIVLRAETLPTPRRTGDQSCP
jgi:hypothetical protein